MEFDLVLKQSAPSRDDLFPHFHRLPWRDPFNVTADWHGKNRPPTPLHGPHPPLPLYLALHTQRPAKLTRHYAIPQTQWDFPALPHFHRIKISKYPPHFNPTINASTTIHPNFFYLKLNIYGIYRYQMSIYRYECVLCLLIGIYLENNQVWPCVYLLGAYN